MHGAGAPDLLTLVLAGGRATRFPGKLAVTVNGEALLSGVIRRLQACSQVVLAGRPHGIEPDIQIIDDAQPGRGPLSALAHAFSRLEATLILVVAGDMPNAGEPLLRLLQDAYRAGDAAVVPEHDGMVEPLAALYERAAFVRAAQAALTQGARSMHGLLERLPARYVTAPPDWFVNINAAADIPAASPQGSHG